MAQRLLVRKPSPDEQDARYVLTISRHWHSPKIEVFVHRRDGIGLQMLVSEFILALIAECPWMLRPFLRRSVPRAVVTVTAKMKEESLKVI